MARRTFERVDANLAIRLGNRSDVTATMRGEWINDALLKCANEYEHPEMEGVGNETLTATTDVITPSVNTDIWWPVMVKDLTTGRVLRPGDKERIENVLTKAPGTPTQFYWWANTFYFNTIPTSNLTIRIWYRKLPVEWTTGVAVLAKVYDIILELYAAENAFNFLREFDKAELAAREAKAYAADMKLPKHQASLNDYRNSLRAGDRR